MWQSAMAMGVMAIMLAGCSPQPTPAPRTTAALATSSPAPARSAPASSALASAAASPSGAASPSAAGSPSVEAWHAVPDQAPVAGTQFQDVAWTGTRFVATGAALGGGGVFLDSPDGLSWHRQPDAMVTAFPDRLAAGPLGVVAVGTIANRPASWTSQDGLSWTTRPDAFPASVKGSDTYSVTDVAATNAGWIAVGREDPSCNVNCGVAPVRSLVWTSRDGLHWTRVASQPSLNGAGMNGIAAAGPGFVAVGAAKGRAVLWTSPSGSVWSTIPDDAMFHPRPGSSPESWVAALGVAAGRDSIVAVGWAYGVGPGGAPEVLAWWSPDGRTWTPAPVERGGEGQVFSVAATPGGFLATGPSGGSSCLGGIWASADGRAWRCSTSDPAMSGFGPYAAAGSPTREIAVGLTSAGTAEDSPNGLPGAVWWRPVP